MAVHHDEARCPLDRGDYAKHPRVHFLPASNRPSDEGGLHLGDDKLIDCYIRPVSSPLRRIAWEYKRTLRLAADARSAYRLVRLAAVSPLRSATTRSGDTTPPSIRLRALD